MNNVDFKGKIIEKSKALPACGFFTKIVNIQTRWGTLFKKQEKSNLHNNKNSNNERKNASLILLL